MNIIYDQKAVKKPTNLSINNHLLSQARDLGINLSATLEHALEAKIRQSARKEWLKNNKAALENCNTLISENGLFADKHRKF